MGGTVPGVAFVNMEENAEFWSHIREYHGDETSWPCLKDGGLKVIIDECFATSYFGRTL